MPQYTKLSPTFRARDLGTGACTTISLGTRQVHCLRPLASLVCFGLTGNVISVGSWVRTWLDVELSLSRKGPRQYFPVRICYADIIVFWSWLTWVGVLGGHQQGQDKDLNSIVVIPSAQATRTTTGHQITITRLVIKIDSNDSQSGYG